MPCTSRNAVPPPLPCVPSHPTHHMKNDARLALPPRVQNVPQNVPHNGLGLCGLKGDLGAVHGVVPPCQFLKYYPRGGEDRSRNKLIRLNKSPKMRHMMPPPYGGVLSRRTQATRSTSGAENADLRLKTTTSATHHNRRRSTQRGKDVGTPDPTRPSPPFKSLRASRPSIVRDEMKALVFTPTLHCCTQKPVAPQKRTEQKRR